MSNIDFSDTSIKECDFSEAIMRNCVFQRLKSGPKTNRTKLDLRGCEFDNTDLGNSVFVFSNLEKVNFSGSDLSKVVFEKCKLANTVFVGARLDRTRFDDCNLNGAVLGIQGFLGYGKSKGFVLESS